MHGSSGNYRLKKADHARGWCSLFWGKDEMRSHIFRKMWSLFTREITHCCSFIPCFPFDDMKSALMPVIFMTNIPFLPTCCLKNYSHKRPLRPFILTFFRCEKRKKSREIIFNVHFWRSHHISFFFKQRTFLTRNSTKGSLIRFFSKLDFLISFSH